MTITEITPIVVAILGSGALITALLQRVLVRRQADNAVVTGATGVIELYQLYAARQDADIVKLNADIVRLSARLLQEEQRCNKMAAVLLRHGINVEEGF